MATLTITVPDDMLDKVLEALGALLPESDTKPTGREEAANTALAKTINRIVTPHLLVNPQDAAEQYVEVVKVEDVKVEKPSKPVDDQVKAP